MSMNWQRRRKVRLFKSGALWLLLLVPILPFVLVGYLCALMYYGYVTGAALFVGTYAHVHKSARHEFGAARAWNPPIRDVNLSTWVAWFAWRPVKTWPIGEWCWMKYVVRHVNEHGQTCYVDDLTKAKE